MRMVLGPRRILASTTMVSAPLLLSPWAQISFFPPACLVDSAMNMTMRGRSVAIGMTMRDRSENSWCSRHGGEGGGDLASATLYDLWDGATTIAYICVNASATRPLRRLYVTADPGCANFIFFLEGTKPQIAFFEVCVYSNHELYNVFIWYKHILTHAQ